MPKEYEAIRDNLIRQGLEPYDAKQRAARIYNKRHPDNPVHGHWDEYGKKKKKKEK